MRYAGKVIEILYYGYPHIRRGDRDVIDRIDAHVRSIAIPARKEVKSLGIARATDGSGTANVEHVRPDRRDVDGRRRGGKGFSRRYQVSVAVGVGPGEGHRPPGVRNQTGDNDVTVTRALHRDGRHHERGLSDGPARAIEHGIQVVLVLGRDGTKLDAQASSVGNGDIWHVVLVIDGVPRLRVYEEGAAVADLSDGELSGKRIDDVPEHDRRIHQMPDGALVLEADLTNCQILRAFRDIDEDASGRITDGKGAASDCRRGTMTQVGMIRSQRRQEDLGTLGVGFAGELADGLELDVRTMERDVAHAHADGRGTIHLGVRIGGTNRPDDGVRMRV